MRRLCGILVMVLALGAMSPASGLADPGNGKGNGGVGNCKGGANQQERCNALAAPEIDPAGGLVPMALIAGALLLFAEGARRAR